MYLGIDFGSKRVGLAVAPVGGPAAPLVVVEWGAGSAVVDMDSLIAKIVRIATSERTKTIVVGLPTSESQSRQAVEEFIARLRVATTLSVETVDERMTTKFANRLTGYHGVAESDAVAAAVILDGYLQRIKEKKEKVDRV